MVAGFITSNCSASLSRWQPDMIHPASRVDLGPCLLPYLIGVVSDCAVDHSGGAIVGLDRSAAVQSAPPADEDERAGRSLATRVAARWLVERSYPSSASAHDFL